MSWLAIGRGSRNGRRTRTVRRTGCWRLAAPTNGRCDPAPAPMPDRPSCIGLSPGAYCSAAIAQSKKLDVAARTRCTVAGESSRPCSVATVRPSRCAGRRDGTRRR